MLMVRSEKNCDRIPFSWQFQKKQGLPSQQQCLFTFRLRPQIFGNKTLHSRELNVSQSKEDVNITHHKDSDTKPVFPEMIQHKSTQRPRGTLLLKSTLSPQQLISHAALYG